MNKIWIVYTAITAFYIIVIAIYFWRRSRKHELELQSMLKLSKVQLEKHRQHVHNRAGQRINQAMLLIKQLHKIAATLEVQAKEEYRKVIQAANDEANLVRSKAKEEAAQIIDSANDELARLKQQRQSEIEADMVRLVMSVTQKVIKRSLNQRDHIDLIFQSLEEVKSQKQKM